MDIREKLVELSDIQVLQREIECVKRKSSTNCTDCLNCDLLMTDERILTAYKNAIDALQNAHGVTVHDRKPLEAFLHPVDAYKGLKAKYLVFKADTGESVENCFVLRPDKDPASVEALRAYASATDNETLAKDIYNWVGKGVTVQEWIPVTERLPKDGIRVLALHDDGVVRIGVSRGYFPSVVSKTHTKTFGITEVTHWMPLPQPLKGE